MKKFLNGLNGFRKWSMGIIFILVSTGLLLSNYIPPDDWLQHVSAVIIAFMSTNIGERVIEAVKDWGKSKKIESVIEGAKDKLGL